MRAHVELVIDDGDHWAEGETVNLAFANGATLELGWSHSGQIVPIDYLLDPARRVVPPVGGLGADIDNALDRSAQDDLPVLHDPVTHGPAAVVGAEVNEAEHIEAAPIPSSSQES